MRGLVLGIYKGKIQMRDFDFSKLATTFTRLFALLSHLITLIYDLYGAKLKTHSKKLIFDQLFLIYCYHL